MKPAILTQARKICLLLPLLLGSSLQAAPDGQEILQRIKGNLQGQSAALSGNLRTEDQFVPFTLEQKDGHSVYRFDQPPQTIDITFSDQNVTIRGVDDPKKPLRGSIVAADDLALRFLYWSDVEVLKIEKIRSLPCWELRLATADRKSTYAIVHLWVNQQSGAFLRADAYDWNGERVRQFEVISTQKAGDGFMLKKMRIQDLKGPDPKITYLEINKPQ